MNLSLPFSLAKEVSVKRTEEKNAINNSKLVRYYENNKIKCIILFQTNVQCKLKYFYKNKINVN